MSEKFYDTFVISVKVEPQPELTKEKADGIVDTLIEGINYTINKKYSAADYHARMAINPVAGLTTLFYVVVPRIESIDEAQAFFREMLHLLMQWDFTIMRSGVEHIHSFTSLKEGIALIDSLWNNLFSTNTSFIKGV